MPGVVKIGYTERTVEERLQEANIGGTWSPPTNYTVEFAKFIKNAHKKERILHKLLDLFRINPNREFFRVPLETVRLYFDLMDGNDWSHDLPELETPTKKEDIYNSFLNEVIYPLNEEEINSVAWSEVASAFTHWKLERGSNRGDMTTLRKTLEDTYGKLNRGYWDSKFKLKFKM